MRVLTLALCIVTGSCFAANPSSPVDPGEEWSGPVYEKLPDDKHNEESWSYRIAGVANLMVIKQLCSSCKPVGRELVDWSSNYRPTEFAVLADSGKYPAMIKFSIEPIHHITFSYGFVAEKHSYRVQLVMLDSIPARESMRLQQNVLRMVSGWEPE